jgi:glycerol uptake operon antiterminator
MDLLSMLKNHPVIAAIRDVENLRIQNLSHAGILFILGGTIFDLPKIVAQAKRSQKLVFVDIDLIKGIGKDAPGIHFLALESQINGIITTRGNLIKSAQKEGLISIQRLFVLDSESLTGGLGAIEKSNPDAIEILPGLILPKVIKRIRKLTSIPVIAGGLITTWEEIKEILDSGAVGVSTSAPELFRY